MGINGSAAPRHQMASLLEPRSVLVVADRPLPFTQTPPATLQNAITVVRVSPGQPISLPDAARVANDARLDLLVVCVPPSRLAEALDVAQASRPLAAVVLRHEEVSDDPAADVTLCRRWGALNDCLLMGPGSFGIQRPTRGINLSLDPYMAPAGRVALVAQSATIMAAVLDWSEDISLGFSALVSIQDDSVVDVADVLDYLSTDARTDSIVLYLEHPASSRSFTSALRAATSVKPVVVLKPGRKPERRDTASQRRAADEYAVFNALLRRFGAVRVRHFVQLFSALKVLVHRRRPRGRRIAILSNGRAGARLAMDAMHSGVSVRPAQLSRDTQNDLVELLEPGAQVNNPIITIRPLRPDQVEGVVRLLDNDPEVDGVLLLLAPDPFADLDAVAGRLASMADGMRKPVVSCFMGDAGMRMARQRLDQAGAPAFRTPESAVEGFDLLASYHYSQTLAQQTLPPEPLSRPPRVADTRQLVQQVQEEGRSALTTVECRALLEYFYIPIELVEGPVRTEPGSFPDVPPLSIRVERDTRFGPYISFSASRAIEWVEASSQAIDLPPLNRYLARQLVQRSSLWGGVLNDRLSPDALELLYESLERVSELVSEIPQISALTIEPLYCDDRLMCATGMQIAIDTRTGHVVPEKTGYRHLAIHPYPRRLVTEMQFPDGNPWLLRPIRPEDAELLQDFIRNLSDESRYMRFVSMLRELTPRMLARYSSIDYDRELALVATVTLPNPRHRGFPMETIIGFAHYLRNPDGRGAEYALAISDEWQRRGLGTRLMRALIHEARNQGLSYIDGYVLSSNRPMLALMASLGFRNDPDADDPGMRRVWLDLTR